MSTEKDIEPIAVIGIGITAKGVDNLEDMRHLLSNGADMIGDFPIERYDDTLPFFKDSFRHNVFNRKERVFSFLEGAFLDSVDKFDANYFKISPLEASLTDPAQRLFLECVLKSLQNAGYGGDTLKGSRTGVFVGYMPDQRPFNYRDLALHFDEYNIDQTTGPNLISIIPSRISYFLDFKGPSVCIDTSCSSTLVALHQACQSLRLNECEYAIAGGIKLNLAPFKNLPRPKIESDDYKSKVFDKRANGIGIGEGATTFLLKPLSKAIKEGDHIWSVIRGSAINQDGRSDGMARPNPKAQTDVIKRAWSFANVKAKNIGLIEAHGTGTKVGDPIEANSLIEAFELETQNKQFCALGSIKANFGHLYEAAAGLSVCKAILSTYYNEIYPQINFSTPSNEIDFINSPLYIPNNKHPWLSSGSRIAGVTAFGVSGTNCHMVLEQPPIERNNTTLEHRTELFVASGRDKSELMLHLSNIHKVIKTQQKLSLANICFTASTNYTHFNWRLALVVTSIAELNEKLKAPERYIKRILRPKKDALINGYSISESNTQKIERLASLFYQGNSKRIIDYYKQRNLNRVVLTGFPLKKERHWYSFPQKFVKSARGLDPRHYGYSWIKLDESIYSSKTQHEEHCLILTRSGTWNLGFKNWAEENWSNIDFHDLSLANEINSSKIEKADRIIHLGGVIEGNEMNLKNEQEIGLFSVWNLLKQLFRTDSKKMRTINLVGTNAFDIDGSTEIKPVVGAFFGLGRIVTREFSNIKCSSIQIDINTEYNIFADVISNETNVYQRAVVNNKLYEQEFGPIDLTQNNVDSPLEIKKDVSYLITGGTGGLGLEFANYLSKKGARHIGLMSRHSNIYGDEKLKLVEDIQTSGCKIYFLKGDIASKDDLENAIQVLEKNAKPLSGILHAAGLPGANLIAEQPKDAFLRVSTPKIEGTYNISEISQSKTLDFVILYSSVATFFPAIGQGDYCAANSYLDSMTTKIRQSGVRAFCVNWVAWRDIGMAYDLDVNVNTTFKAISTNDAIHSLDMAFRFDVHSCLIGELNKVGGTKEVLSNYGFNLNNKLSVMLSKLDDSDFQIENEAERCNHNVKIIGIEEDDITKPIKLLSAAFAGVLGYKSIDVNANIYDLGADSLMITQIASVCKRELKLSVDIGNIIMSGSVMELSKKYGTVLI